MDPVIGAGLIAGAGSLIGGLFNSSAQSSANEANLQMFRENQAWQEKMWNKTNEYNSPQMQVQRLRAAGLNPALMYGGGSASAGSADAPKLPSAPTIQPVTGLGDSFGAASGSIADSLIKLEQVKQMREQTKLLAAKTTKEINSTYTPQEYGRMLRSRLGLWNAQSSLADSKAAGQDIYNRWMPTKYGYEESMYKLGIEREKQNIITAAFNRWLGYANYKIKAMVAPWQVEVMKRTVNLAEQKFNFLEKMNPAQLNQVYMNTWNALKSGEIKEKNLQYYDESWWLNNILRGIDVGSRAYDHLIPDM